MKFRFDEETINLYISLFENRTWITQRVDTYSLEDPKVVRHKISVSIDWEEVFRIYQPMPDVESVQLPIGSLKNHEILDFGFSGDSSGSVLVPRDTARSLCINIFDYVLYLYGIDIKQFSSELRKFIYQRLREDCTEFSEVFAFDSKDISRKEYALIRKIYGQNRGIFEEVYNLIIFSRILFIRQDISNKKNIIKYNYMEPMLLKKDDAIPENGFLVKIGTRPYVHTIHAPELDVLFPVDIVNFASPSGTRISEVSCSWFDEDEKLLLVDMNQASFLDGHTSLNIRKTPKQIIGNATSLVMKFSIVPSDFNFIASAIGILLLTNVMIIIGGITAALEIPVIQNPMDLILGRVDGEKFCKQSKGIIDSTPLTLIGALPSIAALFLASQNEHRFNSSYFSLFKIILAASTASTMILIFTYSLGVCGYSLIFEYWVVLLFSIYANFVSWRIYSMMNKSPFIGNYSL